MLDNVVDFFTNPTVVMIVLPIIALLFASSLFSSGIGLGGIVGCVLIGCFFIVHYVADYTSTWTILLFIFGLILIILEIVVPGMIVGILGIIAIICSILFTGASLIMTAYAIAIALIVAIVGVVVMVKIFGKKMSVFNRMVLSDSTDTESGYVSNVNRTDLLEREAETVTALRPSGVAMLDGERLDVVSEGSFIDAAKKVIIIEVEGSRIVVREKNEE
ncbi:MAG: nodulation efficiency protein NfeD [Kurthia sp.]|nr:nodulation efficiency protein NfeD [Candidatus Kurthia equi]